VFIEYTQVRIVRLNKENRPYTGSESVSRPPQIGDVAIIVEVLENGREFIVENVNANGYTIWLADFVAEELESA
jgi:hypothetical protein